jgi:hypothetical protein
VSTNCETWYLAGPVQHVADGGKSWRDRIKDEYGHRYEFNDPLDKYNVPLDDLDVIPGRTSGEGEVSVAEIVEGDKELLFESDAVLVGYEAVQSVGTPMEVMWAFRRGYKIVLWIRDDTDPADLSPWYHYHVDEVRFDLSSVFDH